MDGWMERLLLIAIVNYEMKEDAFSSLDILNDNSSSSCRINKIR